MTAAFRSAEQRGGLVAKGIQKSFGATRALGGVDLDAPFGSITALIGQNGAGKSTLMGVLSGSVAPDEGSITFAGAPFRPRSPLEARSRGVAMVHQELSLCPHLSVRENVLLGDLPRRFGLVDWPRASRMTDEALAPLVGDQRIDPRTRVSDLSIANQQLVEIARALRTSGTASSERVLILDEPTSSLARGDVERLFVRLRELRDAGYAIVYISHFLDEVKRIADRFVVLRDGKTVGSGDVEGTSIDTMIQLMAGRAIEALYPRTERNVGEVVIETRALVAKTSPGQGEGAAASLELHRGEVVGIAGLLGAGRTELFRAIFGLDGVAKGALKVKLVDGPRSPHARWRAGVGYASEDRKEEGLALALDIASNLTLSRKPRFFIRPSEEPNAAQRWIEKLSIKATGPKQRVEDLSGGNQQKVALARLLHHNVDVLLLDEPTRGIDVESKAQIYALIDELAQSGKAVLMISSYFPELLGVCDRVHVMRRGALGPSLDARTTDETTLLKQATIV